MWRSLALGVGLSALWLAGWETFWRSRNFVPTLTNDEALWCAARSQANAEAVVIVGSSRLQRGLDPQILSETLGGSRVIQLALDGANSLPVLRDLARDASFRGTVLLEYMPKRWFLADSPGMGRSQSFIGTCSSESKIAGVEARLDQQLQQRFVFLSPEVQFITLLSHVASERELPRESTAILREDRFLQQTFRKRTGPVPNDPWVSPLTPIEIEQRLTELKEAVTSIHARGGCVVVYRSPVTDGALADEAEHFPEPAWFLRSVQTLGASGIDFAAVPALRDIKLPDGSHPDVGQVPGITTAVANELRLVLRECNRPSP